MLVGVGHAAPLGAHRAPSTAGGPAVLFGSHTVQPAVAHVRPGEAEAFPFAVSKAGTVSSVSVYVDARNQAKTLEVALYSSHAGQPVRRVAAGTLSSPKAGSWNAVSLTPAAIQSPSTDWLAVLGRAGTLYFRDARTGSCQARADHTSLTSLPQLWTGAARVNACSISAFAIGHAAGAGAGSTPLTFGTFHPANPAGPSASTPAAPNSGTLAAPTAPNTAAPALPGPTLPPVNTGAPAINGSPVEGNTLTSSTGSWIDSPTSYGYQWQDCNSLGVSCTDISGATASSYTLQASDVGSTIRSVVTASNSAGSASASSAATATVTAPPPPAAPTNTAAPAVSGQAVQGQTLSTSNGSWTGSPTSYGYRWQDCNSSGASCTNISGATASTYTLQAGDVGSTIRSVVTATNSGGSTPASSAATAVVTSSGGGGGGGGGGSTQVGAPTPAGVTCTQTLNPGANVQSAVSGASSGSTICLNPGSWSAITLSNLSPSSPGVTVAATPGQTVNVPGFTLSQDNNLTIEGFTITSGGNGHGNGIDVLCQTSGGIVITHNTIENISGGYAIHGYSGACGGSSPTQNGVSITYNQLDHASTFVEADGNSCACASADTNWTISHNVMGPGENYGGAGHYIQGQWIGATIDNNAFEGPTVFNSNAHNNVLHCYSTNAPGCQNITFDNNIIWHAQSRAQTILISDNNLTGIHIDNNLDIDDPACGQSIDCPASPWFVEKGYNYTLMHNTSVGAVWSVNMGTCGDGCVSNPNNWDAEYNIAVGPPAQGQNNFGSWQCQSSCTTAHNTSQDGSANSDWGGSGNVVNWTPAWQSTSWTPVNGPGYQAPPAGYYQPTGLSISGAGYQGHIGP